MKNFSWVDKHRKDVEKLLSRGHSPGYVSDWLKERGCTLGSLYVMSKQCPEIADLMERNLWEIK